MDEIFNLQCRIILEEQVCQEYLAKERGDDGSAPGLGIVKCIHRRKNHPWRVRRPASLESKAAYKRINNFALLQPPRRSILVDQSMGLSIIASAMFVCDDKTCIAFDPFIRICPFFNPLFHRSDVHADFCSRYRRFLLHKTHMRQTNERGELHLENYRSRKIGR